MSHVLLRDSRNDQEVPKFVGPLVTPRYPHWGAPLRAPDCEADSTGFWELSRTSVEELLEGPVHLGSRRLRCLIHSFRCLSLPFLMSLRGRGEVVQGPAGSSREKGGSTRPPGGGSSKKREGSRLDSLRSFPPQPSIEVFLSSSSRVPFGLPPGPLSHPMRFSRHVGGGTRAQRKSDPNKESGPQRPLSGKAKY